MYIKNNKKREYIYRIRLKKDLLFGIVNMIYYAKLKNYYKSVYFTKMYVDKEKVKVKTYFILFILSENESMKEKIWK